MNPTAYIVMNEDRLLCKGCAAEYAEANPDEPLDTQEPNEYDACSSCHDFLGMV